MISQRTHLPPSILTSSFEKRGLWANNTFVYRCLKIAALDDKVRVRTRMSETAYRQCNMVNRRSENHTWTEGSAAPSLFRKRAVVLGGAMADPSSIINILGCVTVLYEVIFQASRPVSAAANGLDDLYAAERSATTNG